MLYDVSSSYYEGHTCPLMQFGHNRDGKRDRPIVVYGVLADAAGRPLTVQACRQHGGSHHGTGSGGEGAGSVRLEAGGAGGGPRPADRDADQPSEGHPGLGWISALRHRQIRRLVESEAVQLSLFDERHLAEVRSPDYPGDGSSCHNPLLADHRRQKREALQATEEALARWPDGPARPCRPPRSPRKSAASRLPGGQTLPTEIADGSFHYERRTEAITRETQLDGFYMLRTSEGAERLGTAEVVRRYKDLTRERAFRSLKTATCTSVPSVIGSRPGSGLTCSCSHLLRPLASGRGSVTVR